MSKDDVKVEVFVRFYGPHGQFGRRALSRVPSVGEHVRWVDRRDESEHTFRVTHVLHMGGSDLARVRVVEDPSVADMLDREKSPDED